jgi:hypothetical protein
LFRVPANAWCRRSAVAEYLFPRASTDPQGLGAFRQSSVLDMRNGYFSNNKLGLWIHTWVSFTPRALNTADGRRALGDLAARNGRDLDGTPIIKTVSDIDNLYSRGYVTKTLRPFGDPLRYAICPVVGDPRRGGIAPDQFLAYTTRIDGLPLEPQLVANFESLRLTGEPVHWPKPGSGWTFPRASAARCRGGAAKIKTRRRGSDIAAGKSILTLFSPRHAVVMTASGWLGRRSRRHELRQIDTGPSALFLTKCCRVARRHGTTRLVTRGCARSIGRTARASLAACRNSTQNAVTDVSRRNVRAAPEFRHAHPYPVPRCARPAPPRRLPARRVLLEHRARSDDSGHQLPGQRQRQLARGGADGGQHRYD